MGVGTLRRHYRNKVLSREQAGEDATAMVYQAKAEAIAGFALPRRFVSDRIRKILVEKNLTTLDDLNGASVAEVSERTGLSKMDAGKVVKAVEREVALRADDQVRLLADFPFQAELVAAGYTTGASIEGLDESELADIPDVGEPGARVIVAYQDGLLDVPFPENVPHLVRLGELGIRGPKQLALYTADQLRAFGMTEQEAAEVVAYREAVGAPAPVLGEPGTPGTAADAQDLPPLEFEQGLNDSQQQPVTPTSDPTATVGTQGENATGTAD
ncbi:hypothetical protein DAETH_48220 (plasmid) [Deinococcus aetherius]|uniref:Uncharacterized protein n=1 Tax=Deinococcus aetherius TaxID=200252 RepID=A0ABM8AM03_9DEIO|nr:hypothetical protein [Deinococcus aetherius]BDP44853.1 hypothetical protein DAETH_48220 [Deinococcus aetherius]